MIEAHQGQIQLAHSFNEAWEYLNRNGIINLSTSRAKEFIAKSDITRDNRRVIRFLRNGIESARSYECCWGFYYNCNRTRFGMYAKSLDDSI